MKNITDFIAANAGILCFGAAWIIAMFMAVAVAFRLGRWKGWRDHKRAADHGALEIIEHWSGR